MSELSAVAPESALNAPQTPVLRIAPARGWWALPLAELWEYRELIYFFVWRDIKVRYKQTAIGASWAVIQPLATMLLFTAVFGKLAHIPSEGLPYAVFYYAALLPWTYFATALQSASNIVVSNQHILTKVYFPRLTLPLFSVCTGLVDFAISFVMFALLLAWYHIAPTWHVIWFPAFLLLAMLTALGVGLWLSALNALYRDVGHILPFLVQFWMFASPVVYSSSMVPAKWRWLYGLNPMAGVIEGFRWSLAGRGAAPGVLFAVSSAIVLLIFIGGLAFFQRMETEIADRA
ncbi:MAG TPA: ABC transporter permease [Candidatus Aquilonibacter sp.]|nr:ABC transporter permease [Candidatus Aquilonibacter sp.]